MAHPAFNLAGATVYAGVAVLALVAAWRRDAPRLHWGAVALMFAGLAVWRLGHGEDFVADWARRAAFSAGAYDQRRAVQAPLAGALMLAGLAAILALATMRGTAPMVRWSRLAALALAGYSLLRALSFHPVDVLIQTPLAGPLRINHAIDMGLAAMAGLCAWRDLRDRDRRHSLNN